MIGVCPSYYSCLVKTFQLMLSSDIWWSVRIWWKLFRWKAGDTVSAKCTNSRSCKTLKSTRLPNVSFLYCSSEADTSEMFKSQDKTFLVITKFSEKFKSFGSILSSSSSTSEALKRHGGLAGVPYKVRNWSWKYLFVLKIFSSSWK